MPLVGSFGVKNTPSTSGASFGPASMFGQPTGQNGRMRHGGLQDGRVEHGELRGRYGHAVPQAATADRNSDSITIDAYVRGEPDGTSDIRMNIAGDDPPLARALDTVHFDANVGATVGLGTEVNSEGSPAKRRRTIRFADEV